MSYLARPLARCLRTPIAVPRFIIPSSSCSTSPIRHASTAIPDTAHHAPPHAQQPPTSPRATSPPSSTSNPNTSTLESQTDDLIARLPLVQSLRANPSYKESRPHRTMNPSLQPTHFVAGSLSGPGMVTVPPFMWMATEKSPGSASLTSRVVSVFHVGAQLCGHPGFVHGGLLSVMFDEAFARCVSACFPSGLGMTANLNVDFRKPAVPDRLYVLRAETGKVEGRKAWVKGTLCSMPGHGEQGEPVLVAEAKALFVEPKFAESMVPLYRG
ncbi:hypothetical protein P170DRAFT_399401 [Aspergillus steynii IBT 23096]|uniref:Thioesterase domain-containing protein n=1 Tax=Aspergillus steynii IBT 23096 TaxID=1392250 RepID=A0A2I2GR34_9EURO|nr:uncharacterized protein P170DRAFT_399401 [Aspergillus steynii IBT 23096]PLB55340.1 hypothetical protein P170DRAFT_399401 [Aspergillus steynii IBT 23096]